MPAPSLTQQISRIPKGLRTRFAPSPTGFLHLGHVASAIYVWGLGRKLGADIVLRMEDHDRGRARKEFEASILSDLSWLGFQADHGVSGAHEPSPFRQSDHKERYDAALTMLSNSLYHCRCSRKEIVGRSGDQGAELRYDGHCRNQDEGLSLRLKISDDAQTFSDLLLGVQEQSPAQQCGDLLLRDRDGCYTYNFAVTVDDIAESIGLIIRGQDILPATGRQIALRRALGVQDPPFYYHHPLIWADSAKKLSKRDRSTSIGQWRDQGLSAAAVIGKAAFQIGLTPVEEPLEAKEVEALFDE